MAGSPGFKVGSVLGATIFPIALDDISGELGHASFALVNDSTTAVLTANLDGQVITLPANTQIQVTGSGNSKSLGLTSTVNPTAFRLQLSPSKIPPCFLSPAGGTVTTANYAANSVTTDKFALEALVATTGSFAPGSSSGLCVQEFTIAAAAATYAFTNTNKIKILDFKFVSTLTGDGAATVQLKTAAAAAAITDATVEANSGAGTVNRCLNLIPATQTVAALAGITVVTVGAGAVAGVAHLTFVNVA